MSFRIGLNKTVADLHAKWESLVTGKCLYTGNIKDDFINILKMILDLNLEKIN